ncbi:MAG: phage major capsid protein [Acidobacteria bacterium]|nr:phage major capsid protein [Acidobacteriota bacterium]
MKTITQYRDDIAALMKKSADIDMKAVAENRDLSEAELALKNEILDAVEEINKTVTTMERQERMKSLLEKPQEAVTVEKGKKFSDSAVITGGEKQKFSSFGEQLASVMRAGLPGGHADPRLFNAAASGLNETTPSDGGFLVQQDFAAGLLEDVFQTGILSSRVGSRIPISGNANGTKINGVDETSRVSSRYGGVVAYWAAEAEEKTKSKPKFRQIELNLQKLIGLCYATDENLDDAAQLEKIIRDSFVGEFGFQVDEAMINGTGAGQPLGIMNAGCLVSVSKESGQAAATILAENISKMYSRRFARQTQNYVWYYNQTIEPQLMNLSISVGTGGTPVYVPPGGFSEAPYGRILGLPAIAIEQASALGTQGDIILGNFKDGYVIAEKGGIKTDMSIHVRFIYDESAFRFVLRIDGQPVRASALTPYKGGSSATQSHFITLDSRS